MAIPATCHPTISRLSPYADGELPPKERTAVEAHLGTCKDCTARVADLRATSGLLRVGLDLAADEVDFRNFSQNVMARITPERPPLWERMRAGLSERWTYQRNAWAGGFAGVALAAMAAFFVMQGGLAGSHQPAQVAINAVTTEESAHVAPVVMKTEQGTIIWLVDHADKNGVGAQMDAGQKAPDGLKSDPRPKGGEL